MIQIIDRLESHAKEHSWEPRSIMLDCVVVVCPDICGGSAKRPMAPIPEFEPVNAPLARPGTPSIPSSTPSNHSSNRDTEPVSSFSCPSSSSGHPGSSSGNAGGSWDKETRWTGWWVIEAIKEFLKIGRAGEPPFRLHDKLQGFVIDHNRVVVERST